MRRGDIWCRVRDGQAQATVEMAVVTPVLLVVALVAYNLMVFLAASARFDRIAPDVVVAHAVAPSGGVDDAAVSVIQEQLEQAMIGYDLDIEVTCEGVDEAGGPAPLTLVGATRTYTCSFHMNPWPGGISIAGVDLGAPLELTHSRAVVVDPWHSGVVM